jgi:methylenetetrahydrofolate dehydrogenase (NAD+)
MLSVSKGKPPTAAAVAAITDWNLQYPSPSAIDVTPLAESLRSKVREFTKNKRTLKLIGVLANEGSHRLDSEIYSDRIQQTFEEDGIDYEVWKYPVEGGGDGDDNIHNNGNDNDRPVLDEEKQQQAKIRWIKDRIQTINSSSDIDGTLVFYPIHPFGPKGPYKCRLTGVYYKTQDDHIRDLIHPSKDVEGLCGTKWFQIRDSRQKDLPSIYPCTALSVLRILEEYHIRSGENAHDGNNDGTGKSDCGSNNKNNNKNNSAHHERERIQQCWKDQTISIVNRSEIMGRPLAVMLAEKGATVYSIDINSILQFRPDGKRLRRCNPKTTTLETCLEESTVIVSGVPSADFRLPLSSIQQRSTIVSVSEFPNVCEETLFKERPDIKYIPQVGKVTVATLSLNLMHLHLKQNKQLGDGGSSDPNQ